MNQIAKIIKPKLELLELAKQLGNVQQAYKVIGYNSRDSYYCFKNCMREGKNLRFKKSVVKNYRKNWVELHIEQVVGNIAYEYPAYGQLQIASQLRQEGIMVSGCSVRSI